MPGVESATLADFSPLNFTVHTGYIEPEGYVPQPHESMGEITRGVVGPKYFGMMKTALISGRDFTDADAPGGQLVAIVNQAFVDRFWPGQDALGKRIRHGNRSLTIVGVARNAKYRRIIYAPEPIFYVPLFQDDRSPVIVHARVSGDPRAFTFRVEEAIHQTDAGSVRSAAFGSTFCPSPYEALALQTQYSNNVVAGYPYGLSNWYQGGRHRLRHEPEEPGQPHHRIWPLRPAPAPTHRVLPTQLGPPFNTSRPTSPRPPLTS